MAINTTPASALPYPDDNTFLKDVPDFIRGLAQSLDTRTVMVFETQSAFGAAVSSYTPGMLAFIKNDNRLMLYTNTNVFVQVWPARPTIFSGSTAPTGTGTAGDVYVQF